MCVVVINLFSCFVSNIIHHHFKIIFDVLIKPQHVCICVLFCLFSGKINLNIEKKVLIYFTTSTIIDNHLLIIFKNMQLIL